MKNFFVIIFLNKSIPTIDDSNVLKKFIKAKLTFS